MCTTARDSARLETVQGDCESMLPPVCSQSLCSSAVTLCFRAVDHVECAALQVAAELGRGNAAAAKIISKTWQKGR